MGTEDSSPTLSLLEVHTSVPEMTSCVVGKKKKQTDVARLAIQFLCIFSQLELVRVGRVFPIQILLRGSSSSNIYDQFVDGKQNWVEQVKTGLGLELGLGSDMVD